MRSRICSRGRILWGGLTLLCMGIIFLNSALNGELSNDISKGIINKLQSSSEKLNDNNSGSHKVQESDNKDNDGKEPSKNENETNKVENNNNVDVSKFNVVIRKSAHFFQFFMLAICAINFLLSFQFQRRRAFIIGLIFVILYACFDESHQLFIDGRSGRVLDVFIDSAGGFVGGGIIMLFPRKKSLINK